MKKITGYLIDRATGLGISGKTVSFQKLDGSAIAAGDTYYLDKSSVTDVNGRFYANMELSPGPVNVVVTVSGSEVKVRKHDEQAKLGAIFSSDISRIARANYGVMDGFLNELAISIPAGHTIRIATGGAVFNGNVFSIEQAAYDIAGAANANAAINPRLDLITLRQYNESASGQDSGRQAVIVTQGSSTNVVPDIPTSADFVDFPLGVVSTAYNAATKTVFRDDRYFTTSVTPHTHPLTRTSNSGAVQVNGFSQSSISTFCPAGYISTGGGDSLSSQSLNTVTSIPNGTTGWSCSWVNSAAAAAVGTCYVICLLDDTQPNV